MAVERPSRIDAERKGAKGVPAAPIPTTQMQ
jgi:hypothetical protein